jgi:hypothetical protein
VSESPSPEERKKRIEELLVRAYLQNLHPVDLNLHPPDLEALQVLPLDVIRQLRVVPLRIATQGGRKVLAVATSDPMSQETIEAVRTAAGLPVCPFLVLPEQVEEVIRNYCGG